MSLSQSKHVSLLLLAGATFALLFASFAQPVDWQTHWLPALLFSLLLALADDLGWLPYVEHNGMIHVLILSALLITGPGPALWAMVVGTALAEVTRWAAGRRFNLPYTRPLLWIDSAAAVGKNGISLFLAGLIYQGLGMQLPGLNWTSRGLLAMIPLLGSYFLINELLEAWLIRVQGRSVSDHFRRHLNGILLLELAPLPLVPFLAHVYLQIDPWAFGIIGATVVGTWKLTQRMTAMRRDLEKRVRELNTLNRVGQAIATSLELDILLNTIYRQVSHLMEAAYFYIALYDEVRDELTFPLVFENGERRHQSGRRARNGLTEYVIKQSRPVLVQEQMEHIIRKLGLDVIGQPAKSWLGVPLAVGDKVLGVITVQSFTRPYAYDETDMALLSTLAAQAAIALENAQLYGHMRRRTAELALLNTVSTAVSATLDLNQVVQIAVTSIMPIMVCQKAALLLLNSPDGRLELAAEQGLTEGFKRSRIWEEGVYLQRLRAQSLVVVSDIVNSNRMAAEIELARREGYRALAEVALVAQNELIGVLSIFYDHIHRFDLTERDLLTTFANQAATAIANARLYSQTDQALARRVDELSAIERIGRELVSKLEPQRVLKLVLDQAIRATGATQGCIGMVHSTQGVINIVVSDGYSDQVVKEFLSKPLPLDRGIVGRVLRSGRPMLVPDVTQEPVYFAFDESVRAQLTVPIRREGVVLGVISLASQQVGEFDEQDANFISQMATQAAVALRNAELFQERSRRVEELSLLYQASLSLASSLDYTDVLDTISRLARHITNSDAVTLYLYDRRQDCFDLASTQGYEAARTDPSSIREQGITRRIVTHRRPVLIPDTLADPDVNPLVVERGIRSLIGVPVMSRGEVLGVLLVNHREPHVYTENDVRLVSALANQAGATIANVRLFSQVSEARDRLEAIINSTQEGILVLDNGGRVVIANAHMEFFSDLHRDQLIGYTVEEIFRSHAETLLNLLGIEAQELRSWMDGLGRSIASERRVFAIPSAATSGVAPSSTRVRFTELFGTPVLDEVGEVIGRLMVFRDISEEKELEQMRKDLTSMMVHDLRSPLTAVLSGLEMIKELAVSEKSDPLAIQAMDVAGRGCENMLTMVNTLLDISRLESGRMPLERAPAPFPPLARSAVSYLSPLAAGRDIVVDMDFEQALPLVEIDNEKIRRVLINFLDNALKFAPDGSSVTLRALRQRTETEDVLVCSVADKGPGVPKDFQDKVFDRFAQAHSGSAAIRRRGSGLGLAFCKLAIEAHDGKVWVESEPGQGSTFYFTLPVAHVEDWLSD